MTFPETLFLTLLAAVATTAVLCGALGRRWRIRHGRPPASALLEPDLHRPDSPVSASQRRKAARLVRRGAAAEEPETARVACLTARQTVRQFENPWYRTVYPLVLMLQALVFSGLAVLSDAEPMRTGYVLCASVTAAMAVYLPLQRSHRLGRARASLEPNEERAARATAGGGTP